MPLLPLNQKARELLWQKKTTIVRHERYADSSGPSRYQDVVAVHQNRMVNSVLGNANASAYQHKNQGGNQPEKGYPYTFSFKQVWFWPYVLVVLFHTAP
jgi:hypothetical protein